MKTKTRIIVVAAGAFVLCLLGWLVNPAAFLGGYLVAWWFWIGTAMGGLSNVWLHNLTGGMWGEAIREPLLRFARTAWIAAVLFIPILLGLYQLYPWAPHAGSGGARWAGEVASPAFKSAWLMPGFFIMRSLVYLAIWSALVLLTLRPGLQRAKPFSAVALLVYGFTTSLAAIDWVMSLMPLWYSSIFGWLVGIGQMLAGMALGVVAVAVTPGRPRPPVFRDLGNLLLMYVMSWAYLAFSQFLIIWSEDLPHEIVWYVARSRQPWLAVGWLLAAFFFFVPLLILLSRPVKESARWLGWLAGGLLGMQLVNTGWLILPSLPLSALTWLWALPLAVLALGALAFTLWRHWPSTPRRILEGDHA